ncbi:hypothetical protein BDF20DRAFT_803539, partial [Mycotypha africana]|uniref:uncharacterized protein n=1 Tax=Mycotypha africana TaxID=64632 RepID=UPI002300C304
MNRLSFRNFHQKHFGPEQKLYWQTFLNPKQQEQQQQQWYYFDEEAEQDDDDEYADPFDEAEYRVDADDPQRQEEFRQHHLESNELNVEDFEEESLNADDSVALQFMSEEALEVFQFSENFRKQKE